jgi:hypothetical protein
LTTDFHNDYPVSRVLTRIPINDKATKDIEIDVDITLQDFISRMCANMGLNPMTAQIGWKSNDDAKRAHARQLATEDDLKTAFGDLLKLKNNTRRTKEVVMNIIHLVSHPLWCIVITSLILLRTRSQSKLQRRRRMETAPQILLIVKNCKLFRRSCSVPSIQAQTIGAISAPRTQTSTSGWD